MGRIPGKNITIKIFALILATALWMYVMNEQNPPIEVSFTIPIEVRNLSSGLMLIDAPETVRVKVKGPRSVIAGVTAKDIQCYVDLKDLNEGRHTVKVNTTIPQMLELVEVNPDKAAVRIDVLTARTFPVELRLKGIAAHGTAVVKSSVNPTEVRLSGPKGQLDLVDKVIAFADISNKDADFSTQGTLMAINKDGKEVEGITVTPDTAGIFVNILRQTVKKTVDVKAIVTGSPPQGLIIKKIEVRPDKVEVGANKDILDKLDVVNTVPINLADIDKNTTRELKLQLPEGVIATPDAITVEITVSGTLR